MATITSAASGLWSATGTWVGGIVPVNADTVIIAAGHDVEFDVDQSGFAAGVTLTITGTLHASTTAGSYFLKLQANMTGAGTLRAGTSGTPYPTNCTSEIVRNSFQITSTSMTLDLNCSEPATKYIRLSGVEAAGQTVLSVDTDVTGETAHWKDGAIIRICDINNVSDTEERTIAAGGVAATTITITSGLTAQKETGALVVLISRNVKITHTSAAGVGVNGGTGGTINAEIRNAATGINARAAATIGGALSNCTTALSSINGSTINAVFISGSNGVSVSTGIIMSSLAVASGYSSALNRVSGGVIDGLISGNGAGMVDCAACLIYGDITGNGNGIQNGGGFSLINVSMNNANDLNAVANSRSFNTLFGGTTEFTGYNGNLVSINNFVESIDHDQTANQYRAWAKGGIVDSDTGTVYTGRTRSYKHGCASASLWVFQNRTFTVTAGGGLVVQCYVRKSATMTYLPRVWILTPGQEPFITGSPAFEDIMSDSVDTWEELNLVYANGGTSPVDVVVRTLAKNATGNVFFDPIVTVLAPISYDIYNTFLTQVALIVSLLPTSLTADGYIKADVLKIEGTDPTDQIRDSILTDATRFAGADVATIKGYIDTEIAAILAAVDTEVAAIKAKTDNLPTDPADESNTLAAITAVLAAIAALNNPSTAAIVTAIFAGLIEGRAFEEIIKDIWAQVVGDFVADDADEPTSIVYEGPNGATQLTHTITDTTRSWS